jgi:hypothetical protein
MTDLRQDITTYSQWISTALLESGYAADFTPSSVDEIERFMRDNSTNGTPAPDGFLAADTGARLFAVGSYLGETIRLTVGGEWVVDNQDPQGEVNVELHLPDGSIIWPVQRVVKRFFKGPEENVAHYARNLGLASSQ